MSDEETFSPVPEFADLPAYEDDPAALRRVFSHFPSGVVALVSEVDGAPRGLVASAFTVGVSIDPPLVSCAIQHSSTTWPLLRRAQRIGVSVLGEGHASIARQIAGTERENRFHAVPLRQTGTDARFIQDSPVWLDCELYAEHPAGDHTIVLLQVKAMGADDTYPPLIFHASQFRTLH